MKSLINISIISLLIFSCDNSTESVEVDGCIDGVEVELWGEVQVGAEKFPLGEGPN